MAFHLTLFFMSLQEYYEDSYKSDKSRPSDMVEDAIYSTKGLANYVLECKAKFLASRDWQGLKILEMGSGRGGVGLHLARMGAKVTLVDFSPSALEQASQVYALEGFTPQVIVADVGHPDVQLPDKYDLIVDSHLLHCLITDPERLSYLQLVREHLTSNGIFVAETMVHRKKLFIPDGFMFDQKNTLWQMFGEWKPVRRILDSLDLEQELNIAGLNITYFMYYANCGFVPHKNFMEIPSEILPAAVRMVLQNK
jgi:SAM-dependent methyltransferase